MLGTTSLNPRASRHARLLLLLLPSFWVRIKICLIKIFQDFRCFWVSFLIPRLLLITIENLDYFLDLLLREIVFLREINLELNDQVSIRHLIFIEGHSELFNDFKFII